MNRKASKKVMGQLILALLALFITFFSARKIFPYLSVMDNLRMGAFLRKDKIVFHDFMKHEYVAHMRSTPTDSVGG